AAVVPSDRVRKKPHSVAVGRRITPPTTVPGRVEGRRAGCRWRVSSAALSIAEWVHNSTVATFLNLLYVSTQLLWWYTVTGAMMVESGQLVAHSLALYVATDRGDAERAEYLQQEHAQPVADLRQRQGGRPLLTPVGFLDQEPHGNQRQRHVMMPAVPGAHLVLVHAYLALAAFETRLNACARLDDARQFPKRRLRECHSPSIARREVILIAVAGVVIGGIARGTSLQWALVRQRTTGDHQPLCGSGAFALHPRLHPTLDHLDGYRTLLTVSDRQSPPGSRSERRAP